MPVTLRLIVGSVLLLAGVTLLAVAVLGARTRLRRNRWLGVRTRATMRSDAAFTAGNRVGAAPAGAAGAVALAGGAVLVAGAGAVGGVGAAAEWVVLAVSAVGTLVLAGVSGVAGDRAAAAAEAGRSAPVTACAGSCAGCDLVAGCRPAADGVEAGPVAGGTGAGQ